MNNRFKARVLSLFSGLLIVNSCYAVDAVTTLAASCAACHGPQGNSMGVTPTLAALNQDYFIQRMQGFKGGSVPSTVMHHHAKGLTSDEISSLATYFAAQPRRTPPALPHQTFQGAQ
jgi:cytochrome subunit of sulfide dehydrogenase